MPSTSQTFQEKLWWPLVVLLLVATPLFGTLAGLIVLAISIISLPILRAPNSFNAAMKQPMLVMFVLATLLFAFASSLTASSIQDMRFVANFLPFILAVPTYFLAKTQAKQNQVKQNTAIILLSFCVLGSFLAFAIALIETQIQGLHRADGYFSGAIIFARHATALGFVGAMGFVLAKGPIRYLFLLGPMFAIGATLLAQSRGTIIAIPVLAVMLAIFLVRRAPSKFAKRAVLIAAISFLIALIALFASGYAARISSLFVIIPDLLQTGSSSDASVNIRLDFYRTGVELFSQAPLIGHGWAHMSNEVYAVLDPDKFAPLLVDRFHFHNDLLNFSIAAGILGIFSYFLFLLAPIIGAINAKRDHYYSIRIEIISLLLVLYFISGLTDMVLGFDLPTILYALLPAIVLGAFEQN